MINNNTLNINNISINYKIINKDYLFQSDNILVFLHEGLGSIELWKNFPEILSNTLKLPALIYDRYGYGKSTPLKESRTTDYLEIEAKYFLPKILEKLNLQNHKKILYGHSDGGSIALIYASLFNDVKAIITEAAHTFVENITIEGLKEIEKNYKKIKLIEKLSVYHGDSAQKVFDAWLDTWLSKNFRNWNIDHYLKGITCPILAIQGEDDEYGSIKQLESIKNNSSGYTEILLIPNCKHIPHKQAKEIVKEKVISFLHDL
jgi:pimeloyl-ACP methyl ester carboxylesterase